jgi:hypothetical protein
MSQPMARTRFAHHRFDLRPLAAASPPSPGGGQRVRRAVEQATSGSAGRWSRRSAGP